MKRAAEAANYDAQGVTCTDEWERLELRCALSMQRLHDPAKGGECYHIARCNYNDLRRYAGGHITAGFQKCPIAGCLASLRRTCDVKRDQALSAQLCKVPVDVDVVWLRSGEVCTQPPPSRSRQQLLTTQEVSIDLESTSGEACRVSRTRGQKRTLESQYPVMIKLE